jgi:acyl carrier protein
LALAERDGWAARRWAYRCAMGVVMEQVVIVRPEIKNLFANVFAYDGEIAMATARKDVPKWDSLQHVALVAAIEEQFGVSLSMDEMIEIRSVRDICNILDRHGV